MDHAEATRAGAAERYLLDELDDAERAAFEEHFFDCPDCAEELRLTATFLAGARRVLAQDAPRVLAERPPRRAWWSLFWPVPAGAAVAFAAVLLFAGWQQLRLRAADAPQAVSWHFLSVTRGEPPAVALAPGQRWIGLTLGQPAGAPAASYTCQLFDEAGAVLESFALPAPARGDEIELVIPARLLQPGGFTLVLSAEGVERARYPFTVERGN
jgi:hypothetical protein